MGSHACDVIHVVNQMRPGGIETMVFDIVQLSKHSSRIFSLENSSDQLVRGWARLQPIAGSLEAFEKPHGVSPGLIFRLARRFRALRPRSVFLHRVNPLFYGGLAARLAGVPYVVHVEHDVWQYQDPRRRRMLERSVRLVRPQHFAISDEIASALREMLPSPRIEVVPGGVDLKRFCRRDRRSERAALGLPGDVTVIGSVGRLEAVKGHRVLVEAMPGLSDTVHVVLVGEGSERETLLQRARELGVVHRLHLLGHRDDIERVMSAMDLFCLPSLGEGLPRVVMEAQGADLPVVASDVGSVRKVVDPATGRMVPASDAKALASALAASLAAPPTPGLCRDYAERHFSIEKMVGAYDRIADL